MPAKRTSATKPEPCRDAGQGAARAEMDRIRDGLDAIVLLPMDEGNTERARMFVRHCAEFLEQGKPFRRIYAKALARALRRIEAAPSPFGFPLLIRPSGSGKIDGKDLRQRAAGQVWALRRKGWKLAAAKHEVRTKLDLSVNQMDHAWRTYGPKKGEKG